MGDVRLCLPVVSLQDRVVDTVFKPILDALYRELMGLGLLGVALYIMIKVQALDSLSVRLFCVEETCYDSNKADLAGKTTAYVSGENTTGHRALAAAATASAECAFHVQSLTESTSHAAGRRLGGGGNAGTCMVKSPSHCETKLLHLYEDLHITLFAVVLLYFAYAIWLLIGIQSTTKYWYRLEALVGHAAGENMVVTRCVWGLATRTEQGPHPIYVNDPRLAPTSCVATLICGSRQHAHHVTPPPPQVPTESQTLQKGAMLAETVAVVRFKA